MILAAMAVAVPLLPLVWLAGYRAAELAGAVAMALTVWALAAVVAAGDGLELEDDEVGGWIRTGIVASALIVGLGYVLSGVHALSRVGYLTGTACYAVAALVLARARVSRLSWAPPSPVVVLGLALVSALVALALGLAETHAPFTLYDAPSYHLYFAARWLQDHTVSILPTPFSDVAQSYAPGNGELIFVWLMAPWHGDFVARAGQFPFWFLGAASLYGIGRRLGAAPAAAVYPALLFMVARPVVEQAVGADVDLVGAAFFAAAIYLGLVAVARNRRADWILWGIAVGLTLGTKYVLLLFVPVLLTMPVAGGLRRRALWALPGLVVFGVSWYLRNWIVAGSPIYPASLSLLGLTLARGAFTRAAMLNTIFHTDAWRLALPILAHGFGVTLALVAWPLAAVGAARLIGRRQWWPHGWLVAVPVGMAVLFWRGLPVNIDARFFLPGVGPALVPIAFLFSAHRRANAVAHGLCLAGLAWVLIGTPHELPIAAPWYMAYWFELNGLIAPASLGLFAGVVLMMAVAWFLIRDSRWAVPVLTLLVASTGTVLARGEDTACQPGRCDRVHVSDPDIRSGLLRAWAWMDDHVHDATVAYTGINLPYPLAGPHLTNRVVYVNLDGHPEWRFHDYDRAYRAGRWMPVPPALAESSGELEPVPAGPGPRDDASRPRYDRLEGFPTLWRHNLESLKVRYVFIARLSAYEVDYQVHDPDKFPVEDIWAQADPSRFVRIYDNEDARLYEVHASGGTR